MSFNLKFILRWDFCITLRLYLFILTLLEQLCMSPIIMTWLLYTFGSRCCLLSFFLLRLCPRCSCIQCSLSLSLHSSLTEWGGSSASLESNICSETMTLAGKCSRSTNPFTSHALLLCFKHYTATDLFNMSMQYLCRAACRYYVRWYDITSMTYVVSPRLRAHDSAWSSVCVLSL